jgi:hypothetical protein
MGQILPFVKHLKGFHLDVSRPLLNCGRLAGGSYLDVSTDRASRPTLASKKTARDALFHAFLPNPAWLRMHHRLSHPARECLTKLRQVRHHTVDPVFIG